MGLTGSPKGRDMPENPDGLLRGARGSRCSLALACGGSVAMARYGERELCGRCCPGEGWQVLLGGRGAHRYPQGAMPGSIPAWRTHPHPGGRDARPYHGLPQHPSTPPISPGQCSRRERASIASRSIRSNNKHEHPSPPANQATTAQTQPTPPPSKRDQRSGPIAIRRRSCLHPQYSKKKLFPFQLLMTSDSPCTTTPFTRTWKVYGTEADPPQ